MAADSEAPVSWANQKGQLLPHSLSHVPPGLSGDTSEARDCTFGSQTFDARNRASPAAIAVAHWPIPQGARASLTHGNGPVRMGGPSKARTGAWNIPLMGHDSLGKSVRPPQQPRSVELPPLCSQWWPRGHRRSYRSVRRGSRTAPDCRLFGWRFFHACAVGRSACSPSRQPRPNHHGHQRCSPRWPPAKRTAARLANRGGPVCSTS